MSSPGIPPLPGAGAPPGGAPGGMPPGAPPGMGGGNQPGGTGAVTVPRPQMGNAAQSLTLVHQAVDMMQKALTGIPMGSDLHTALLRSIQELSKRTSMDAGNDAAKMQALVAAGRQQQQNPQQAALQRMQPPGPNAPPAM